MVRLVVLIQIAALAVWPECALADKVRRHGHSDSFLSSIPARPADAVTGSEFARLTAGMDEADRQAAALAELRRGNVPDFMRRLKPVKLTYKNNLSAVVWVTPDYLAIGSDQDFLRIPLTLASALAAAEEFGCVLPTPRIVDAIYRQSEVKLSPQPLPAGPQMASNGYYLRHQAMVQQQLQLAPPGQLVAGHKKDVVYTSRLFSHPGKIAIYGWHRLNGRPIQPLSTIHGAGYADYSHGIRLVSAVVQINGQNRLFADLMRSPLWPLLSSEGSLPEPQQLALAWNRQSRPAAG